MMIRTTTTKTAIVSFAEIGIPPDIHFYIDWLGYDEGWYNAERELIKEEAQLVRDQITAYGEKLLGPKTTWSFNGPGDTLREVKFSTTVWQDEDV